MAEGATHPQAAGATEFLRYESLEAQGKMVGIIAEKRLVNLARREVGRSTPVAVVLDRTPLRLQAAPGR